MICGNCGFQNTPGDEFCGSCGHFLAWTGSPEDSTRADAAAATGSVPPPPPPPAGGTAPDSPTVVAPIPGHLGQPGLPPPPPAAALAGGQAAINWPAGLQRCDVCGTANELSRTFCLNCGAKLKKAGTTSGAALAVAAAREERRRGTRMVLYVIGGVILFVLAASAAFVALGGLTPAPTPGPPAPLATLIASNPSASLTPGTSPLASLVAPASGQPVDSAPASLEPPPTAGPTTPLTSAPPDSLPPPTTPPATAPPARGFTCSASTFSATQPGNWRIFHSHWNRRLAADTLFLEFQPSSSASIASVDANILPPDQVQPTYGVPGPSSGSVAVVLAFNDAVGASSEFGSPVGYKALQEFQIYRSAGRVIVVMGVNGAGCYGLSSDAWTTGASGAPELAIALQH